MILLVICSDHPAPSADAKETCEHILGKIRGELAADVYVTIQQGGTSRQLEQVLGELLTDMQPADVSTQS